jgi:hypothetical protein
MEEEWTKGKAASGEEEESFDDIIKAGAEEEIKVTTKNLEILRTRVSKLEEEKAFRVAEQVCFLFFFAFFLALTHTHTHMHRGVFLGVLRSVGTHTRLLFVLLFFPNPTHTQTHTHTGASFWGAGRFVGSHTRVPRRVRRLQERPPVASPQHLRDSR